MPSYQIRPPIDPSVLSQDPTQVIQFITLEASRKLGRVNFRKDFWDCY